ncbi:hypothetical protein D910_05407 [Dendroctonus ponderosae]|uniref:Pre-C2HC domain-containing protein n=1 Tax=Dendroctonus ponderosae TaxID=77166 RepID=U4U6R8_DENPD|nr:hypothetical protein D910_05407 [Dendroctonus ponderosae]
MNLSRHLSTFLMVVLSNLHPSTREEDIKTDLNSLGHNIRNVSNIPSRITKNRTSLFFVDLAPQQNNKDIYKITLLQNALVTVEPPRKSGNIVQCTRCQRYRHTKNYCTRPFRCVNCTGVHPTTSCTKNKNSPATRVLCEGSHTANYKGCTVYNEIQKQQNRRTNANPRQNNTKFNTTSTSSQEQQTRIPHRNQTYSDTLKNNKTLEINTAPVDNGNLNGLFSRLEGILTKQAGQLTSLINLLTHLLTTISKNAP